MRRFSRIGLLADLSLSYESLGFIAFNLHGQTPRSDATPDHACVTVERIEILRICKIQNTATIQCLKSFH